MPARRTTPKGYATARKLRKDPTPAERKLWALIRNDKLGVKFRRQHAIGNYIPDFVCIKKKLIVELDGSQHLEQVEYDTERTKHFETLGYKVIRFWNNQIMNDINGVIKAIQFALEDKTQAQKSHKRRRNRANKKDPRSAHAKPRRSSYSRSTIPHSLPPTPSPTPPSPSPLQTHHSPQKHSRARRRNST